MSHLRDLKSEKQRLWLCRQGSTEIVAPRQPFPYDHVHYILQQINRFLAFHWVVHLALVI